MTPSTPYILFLFKYYHTEESKYYRPPTFLLSFLLLNGYNESALKWYFTNWIPCMVEPTIIKAFVIHFLQRGTQL